MQQFRALSRRPERGDEAALGGAARRQAGGHGCAAGQRQADRADRDRHPDEAAAPHRRPQRAGSPHRGHEAGHGGAHRRALPGARYRRALLHQLDPDRQPGDRPDARPIRRRRPYSKIWRAARHHRRDRRPQRRGSRDQPPPRRPRCLGHLSQDQSGRRSGRQLVPIPGQGPHDRNPQRRPPDRRGLRTE